MNRKTVSIEDLYQKFLSSTGVTTDTRRIKKGNIFFALKGDNFNGNKFAINALNEGCSFAVVDEEVEHDDRLIYVPDTLKTLQELASHHRKMLGTKIIGLTGSNGKTTTKELIHQVLSSQLNTLSTEGNLNNHIGVPLTLLRLTQQHEIGVIEMGANHQGEIKLLSEIASPDMGVITNIGKAHLEGFGGEEGVKKGKGELFDYLRKKKGKVFLFKDSNVLRSMADGLDQFTYGTKMADLTGNVTNEFPYLEIEWNYEGEIHQIKTHLTGPYNLPNILCAISIGISQDVPANKINRAIESYVPSNSRSQIVNKKGITLILDAYNANPSSMEAAILNLANLPGHNKFVFLGDMRELGDTSLAEHQKIIRLLQEKGIKNGALVGPVFSRCESHIPVFENVHDCIQKLDFSVLKDGKVLIKGSRGIKMELVADRILEHKEEPS